MYETKEFAQFFTAFLKCALNLEFYLTKMILIAYLFPKL